MGAAVPFMAVLGPLAGLAGGAMSYAGAKETGQANYNSGMMQAQIAAQNAVLANRAAGQTMEAGNIASWNKGLQTRQQIGTQETTQAASGIDVNSGSAAAVRAGTREVGMADALTIRANAANAAYGQEVQANSDINQANLDVYGAQNAKKAAQLQADAGLINGVSTAGGQFAAMQKSGAYQPISNFFGF